MNKKQIFKIIAFSFLALFFLFLIYSFYPVITHNYEENKPNRVFVMDRNWVIIADKANEYWYRKEIDIDFDSKFVKSLLLTEDKRYYSHFWIDLLAKGRAFYSNIRWWKIVSGGSTITEQYIKNEYFINNKRSYLQKAREAVIAFYYSLPFVPNHFWTGNSKLENKQELLSEYLNNIYFWNNIYWVWAAIDVYFWKEDINDLTDEEIVLLISILNNPSIKNLKEKQFPEYFEIVKDRLEFDFERTIFELPKKEYFDKFPFVTNNLEIDENWRTTVDSKLLSHTEKTINDTLAWLKKRNVTNAWVFAINPRNGEVLIYVWSRDFYSKEIDWQVNIIKADRQPGSTMKPFLYLMALEEWASINSLLLDIESQYNSYQEDRVYISENYSLKEYGLVRLSKALWNSFNNSTVRLARELWLEKVYNFYKDYAFRLPEAPEYYGYSLVLWNPSISLEELVYSYSKLLDFSDKNKFLLYQILSNPDNRDVSFWVNSILNTSIFQAVKTWTSSNFRDNLVVSYHPDLVVWVWVGNNDNSPMIWVTWITWAWYIWHQIIEEAIKLWYIKERIIDIPEWIEKKAYCLNENCFRKEMQYDKEDIEYFSRILDWKYNEKDLFEQLSTEEKEYLEVLGFYLD